jgi:hypothetical protein
MIDIKYEFITLNDIDDDYEEIPCTDKKEFDFITLSEHMEESGFNA